MDTQYCQLIDTETRVSMNDYVEWERAQRGHRAVHPLGNVLQGSKSRKVCLGHGLTVGNSVQNHPGEVEDTTHTTSEMSHPLHAYIPGPSLPRK